MHIAKFHISIYLITISGVAFLSNSCRSISNKPGRAPLAEAKSVVAATSNSRPLPKKKPKPKVAKKEVRIQEANQAFAELKAYQPDGSGSSSSSADTSELVEAVEVSDEKRDVMVSVGKPEPTKMEPVVTESITSATPLEREQKVRTIPRVTPPALVVTKPQKIVRKPVVRDERDPVVSRPQPEYFVSSDHSVEREEPEEPQRQFVEAAIEQPVVDINVPIVVDEDLANRIIAANGRDVFVEGDSGVIVITGGCGKLSISGDRNQVQCDSSTEVDVTGHKNTLILGIVGSGSITGDDNVVAWGAGLRGGDPVVATTGLNNEVDRLE